MNRYRWLSTRDLIECALYKYQALPPTASPLIYALAMLLKTEHTRANRQRDISNTLARRVNVAKPHITLVKSLPGTVTPPDRAIWRCVGVFRSIQFGNTPAEAYNAWRNVMERQQPRHL